MTQIQQIAATFVADMPNLNNLNPSRDRQRRGQRPRRADAGRQPAEYQERRRTTCSAGRTPPIRRCRSPDNILSSGFYTQINAAVSALSSQRRRGHHRRRRWRSPVERPRHLAVFRLHVAAAVRHQRPGRADRRRQHGPDRPAGQRAIPSPHRAALHHRILYARPDARPGDARIDVRFPGQRPEFRWPGAGHRRPA